MKSKAINKATQDKLTPDVVLEDLMNGNKNYIANNNTPCDNQSLMKQTEGGQFPKAVVLSCIDSRVPVEQIFDQVIGDIFVARVAGNFENTDILGSLEYSCKVSGSKVVMVLGHQSCGAVKAACDNVELGNITALLSNIQPAVEKSKKEINGIHNSSNVDFVNRTIANNVQLTIERIVKKSPILQEMEQDGAIKIVGAIYALDTGRVTLL